MSTKICTSIEQSKKLLSLGLDPITADMFYPWHIEDEEDTFEDGYLLNTPVIGKYGSRGTIPCWSFTALLELMPLFIRTDNGDYNFSLARGGAGAYTFSYIHSLKEPWELGYNLHLTTHKDSVIDAAFEMVCWLIEQGHIKKQL